MLKAVAGAENPADQYQPKKSGQVESSILDKWKLPSLVRQDKLMSIPVRMTTMVTMTMVTMTTATMTMATMTMANMTDDHGDQAIFIT